MYAVTPRPRAGLGRLGDTVAAMVQAAAAKYGVDPNLALAVANQESGLSQSKTSSAGAIGVMQLMPGTAAGLGVNPYDVAQNIDGGIRYLAQQLSKFGSVPLALAAYNAGPGAVQQYGGVPPYPETQNYVASILSVYTPSGDTSAAASPDLSVLADSGVTLPAPAGSAFSLSSLGLPDLSNLSPGVALAGILGGAALLLLVVD